MSVVEENETVKGPNNLYTRVLMCRLLIFVSVAKRHWCALVCTLISLNALLLMHNCTYRWYALLMMWLSLICAPSVFRSTTAASVGTHLFTLDFIRKHLLFLSLVNDRCKMYIEQRRHLSLRESALISSYLTFPCQFFTHAHYTILTQAKISRHTLHHSM